ncbi:hypothetical protein ABZ942_19775 [Nocardia sp. NPDC046473]|uniref:hypothetical protein n=1 Tax=Nocardia sp. NPDC046473 TaxID=3155733 RepID=UPI0034055498
MSTPEWDDSELTALKAEDRRLRVVDGVLDDMLMAATHSMEAKNFQGDCQGELSKVEHHQSVSASVWSEKAEVTDRLWDIEFGRERADQMRAEVAARLADSERTAQKSRRIGRSR